jgi:hypothetical protein
MVIQLCCRIQHSKAVKRVSWFHQTSTQVVSPADSTFPHPKDYNPFGEGTKEASPQQIYYNKKRSLLKFIFSNAILPFRLF